MVMIYIHNVIRRIFEQLLFFFVSLKQPTTAFTELGISGVSLKIRPVLLV